MNTLPLGILIIITFVSLYAIIKAADYFVAGAASVSRKMGISPFVVGLTVVAVGTSAPELFINSIAAAGGATDLSIGNILGSNIADILLGLGIPALLVPLALRSQTVWKELPFSLLGAVLILLLGSDVFVNHTGINVLNRSDGFVLLAFFIIFLVYTIGLSKEKHTDSEKIPVFGWWYSLLLIGGGVIGLIVAGKLVVASAVAIAQSLGLSQNLIGLTVVAAGTSLPEIVTSIAAARKGHIDMVVGGIIGTIIFNIFFALGVTAVIAPLPFGFANMVDVSFLIFTSALFFVLMFLGRRHTLTRVEGGLFVVFYIIYLLFALWRG